MNQYRQGDVLVESSEIRSGSGVLEQEQEHFSHVEPWV